MLLADIMEHKIHTFSPTGWCGLCPPAGLDPECHAKGQHPLREGAEQHEIWEDP